MRIRKTATLLTICSIASACAAAPVEYDTDAFHLIVSRPFDSWSGDLSVMGGELDTIRSRRARFMYFPSERQNRGAGLALVGGTTDDPLTAETVKLVTARGFTISQRGSYHWGMGMPAALDPKDYPLLRQAQSALYDALIREQGDPDQIPSSASSRRLLGNLLALGAIGAGMSKFGATGGYVVTTAFAGDISQLPVKVRQSFAPFDLPELGKFDISEIDVYPVKVNEGGSPGQVIVAYKTPPTDADRQAALVLALASLTGSDTTPEAIEASRAADLKRRKDYWSACVAAKQCGSGGDHPSGENK